MKLLLNLFLITFLISNVTYAQSQFSNGRKVDGTFAQGLSSFKNYVQNGLCAKNASQGITASGGSLTRGTTTPLAQDAGSECVIDASASGQTYTFATNTFSERLNGGNCEVQFAYQGDASLYKVYVNVGASKATTDLQLSNIASGARQQSIFFPCGDPASAKTFVVESTSASAAEISLIVGYMGQITNIGSIEQATFYGGMDQAGAAGGTCLFSENTSTSLSNFVALGTGTGCNAWSVTGGVTAQGTNDHRAVTNNLPPGNYKIDVLGVPSSIGGSCVFRLSDGSNTYQPQLVSGASPNLSYLANITTPGNYTWTIQAADNGTSCALDNSAAGLNLAWRFYRFPNGSLPASISEGPSFTNPVSYTPTFVGWSSQPISIEFRWWREGKFINIVGSGNANSSSTGSAFSFTLPSGLSADTTVLSSNNVNKVGFLEVAAAAGSSAYPSVTNAGPYILHVDSTTPTLVNVADNSASGQVYNKQDVSDIGTTNRFIVSAKIPISGWSAPSFPVPIVVGSVSSGSSGAERIERVFSSATCSASPCAITNQSGSWISSITRTGTGAYTANIASGTFIVAPTCVVLSGQPQNGLTATPTTTAVSFETRNSTGTLTDAANISLMCMGAR